MKNKIIIIWLILLTLFVLWGHFGWQIRGANHHLNISVSSRVSWYGCSMEPKIGFDWWGLRYTEYSIILDPECDKSPAELYEME